MGLLTALLLSACAVPVPPTGGPPDSTPPSLVESEPAAGSVDVSADRLVFTFSEPVDQASFLSAFSITPELSGPVELGGSGRSVVVRLPEELREETTYRVTLDTGLRDRRGVSLDAPITLAFATGSMIDQARLEGRMLRATDGDPASGVDILAFAAADSAALADGPLYRTQTGADGRFKLDYVRQDTYFVVGLQDRNRNRMIDPGEWVAIPPMETLQADTVDASPSEPWILANPDREGPAVDRVRAISESELEIRMSESLRLQLDHPIPNDNELVLSDSSGSRSIPISSLWFRQPRARTLFANAQGLTPGTWTLSGTLAAADSAGNAAAPILSTFVVPEGLPAPNDAAFLSWTPDSLAPATGLASSAAEPRTVWPQEQAGFRLTRPASDISVTFSDSSGQDVTLPLLQLDPTLVSWDSAEAPLHYEVSVRVGDADSTHSIWLQTATARQLGALGMAVEAAPYDPNRLIGRVFHQEDGRDPLATTVMDDGLMLFDNLPGGFRGRILVFVDQDGDGTWNPGSLSPYMPAEPVRWHTFRERVRPRWDTIAADTLRFTLPSEDDE